MPERTTGKQPPGEDNGKPPQNTAMTPTGSAPSRRTFWAWILLALALVVLDQATKLWFDGNLQYGQRWPLLPFFDFTLVYNTGAAFSFLADGQGWQRWLFTGIAVIATIFITRLLWKHPQQRLLCAALACILGGALGNAIDRVLYGHVVDFLLFYWQDWYFPAFNVADVAITVGAILLLLDEVIRWRREKRQRDQSET